MPDERERLLVSARAILERSGPNGFKIKTVLSESHLSTRAFYRHFEDKEDLLRELMEQHYAALAQRSREVLTACPDPLLALKAWLHLMLVPAADPGRAAVEAAFAMDWQEVRRAHPEGFLHAVGLLLEPLIEALDRLRSSGHPHVQPRSDAALVLLLTRTVLLQAQSGTPMDSENGIPVLWSFVCRALTLSPPP
ncbi:MAG: betI 17 [Frankiales bacterium]|nr:betI 17 [Frankiales bacterium]